MSSHLPGRKVCAVCGRVLNRVEGVGWIHGLGDPSLLDHPAVPVDDTEVSVNAMCDFCYRPDPEYLIPASEFKTLFAGSGADWAACEACCQLIERNRWNALLDRVKIAWAERHGEMPPAVESHLRSLYRQLRKHITGPARRV